jgi:hypothetical protein
MDRSSKDKGSEILLVGPVGHQARSSAELEGGDEAVLEYKGFQLIARARRGPVGWVAELQIVLSPPDSPVHGFVPVGRFHGDRETAIQQAFLEGIMRVERGEVIGL